MKLNVSALMEEVGRREGVPVEVALASVETGGDLLGFPTPVTGTADALSTAEGILVHFQLQGEAELQCARCLQAFRFPVSLRFTEEFRPGSPTGTAGDLEQDAESGASYVVFQGDQISLDDTLRQEVLLALPLKPLCSDACKGLCPQCGQNLNEAECSCQPTTHDPRFSALEDLKRRLNNDP